MLPRRQFSDYNWECISADTEEEDFSSIVRIHLGKSFPPSMAITSVWIVLWSQAHSQGVHLTFTYSNT